MMDEAAAVNENLGQIGLASGVLVALFPRRLEF
jgi:hypothetical protein